MRKLPYIEEYWLNRNKNNPDVIRMKRKRNKIESALDELEDVPPRQINVTPPTYFYRTPKIEKAIYQFGSPHTFNLYQLLHDTYNKMIDRTSYTGLRGAKAKHRQTRQELDLPTMYANYPNVERVTDVQKRTETPQVNLTQSLQKLDRAFTDIDLPSERRDSYAQMFGEDIEPTYTFPTVRKKRKTWKGQKRYADVDLNVRKMFGYIGRSLAKQFKDIDVPPRKNTREKMLRSISHKYQWAIVEHIRTPKIETFEYYYQYYKELVYACIHEELSTNGRYDAWYNHVPQDNIQEFIRNTYAPTEHAFLSCHDLVKEFMTEEWIKYRDRASKIRENRTPSAKGKLTIAQVDALEERDMSHLKLKFGV